MSRPALAAEPLGRHLILVGLPGAGKSAVGRLVAAALGRRFLDFDVEISRREGMGIAEIFERKGEQYFRALEQQLTQEVRDMEGMVLSPGGGWVSRPETVALVRPPATLMYLRVTPATALRRMGRGVSQRPLLRTPDPLGELSNILAARGDIYEGADLIVDVEGITLQQVSERVVAAFRDFSEGMSAGQGTPG